MVNGYRQLMLYMETLRYTKHHSQGSTGWASIIQFSFSASMKFYQ